MAAPAVSMRFRRRRRGVALIEALVVLLILGLSALSLSGVQSLLWLNGETARQREQALQMALSHLEGVRAQALTAYEHVASTPAPGTKTEVAGTVFAVRHVVTTGGSLPYKTVNVVVRWSDRSGRQQDVVLSTVVSRPLPRNS
jgi:Tfp pilus assembly protein PilV